MKKIVYSVLATLSGLVLLFSYRTSHTPESAAAALDSASTGAASTSSATGGTASGSSSGSSSSGSSSTGTGSSQSGSTSGSTSGTSSSGLTDGTYTGSAVNTRYGPVQVQITVSGGQITDVQVPEYPSSNGRDRQINSRALPILISETMSAQSADIHMVSGATYTSDGYQRSLQSALDEARG